MHKLILNKVHQKL